MSEVSDTNKRLMRNDLAQVESILGATNPDSTPRISRGLLEKVLAAATYFAGEDSRKGEIVEQLGTFIDSTSTDLAEVQERVETIVAERDHLCEENEALKTRIAEYAHAYESLNDLADGAETLAGILQDEVAGDEPLPWEKELEDLTHRLDDRPTLEVMPGEVLVIPNPDEVGELASPEVHTNTV